MVGRCFHSTRACLWLLAATSQAGAAWARSEHPLSLLSRRATAAAHAIAKGAVPVGQSFEDSMKEARDAAKQAWALSHQVDEEVHKSLSHQSDLEREIAMAKAAAETAKKEDETATALFYATRSKAVKAAFFSARSYYEQVRKAAANADVKRKDMLSTAAGKMQRNAATSASSAAMPYQQQLLQGQRIVSDYFQRAQALGAASVNLKKESSKLSKHAEAYQQNNQLAEAQQMLMQAHSLMSQGELYANQAAQLESTAREINSAFPALQSAGQAAAESAAMSANEDLFKHYPY